METISRNVIDNRTFKGQLYLISIVFIIMVINSHKDFKLYNIYIIIIYIITYKQHSKLTWVRLAVETTHNGSFFKFLFIYSHVHTLFGSFLLPASTPNFSLHPQ
jgi:hypothetical protein